MRSIDADSLKNTLEYGLLCNIPADSKDSESEKLNTWIQNVIDKEPTVTPQEEKVGYWIDVKGENATCGCCNRLNIFYGTYCKHCGARMVLQESED